MTTYNFDSITPAQARAFDFTLDRLSFDNPADKPATIQVAYEVGASAIILSSATTGHSVTFTYPGDAVWQTFGVAEGDFPDGSFVRFGGFGNDHLFGSAFVPGALFGGPGNDTFQANAAAETMSGGSGNDLFIEPTGSSKVGNIHLDTIVDWHVGDHVDFTGVAGVASNYSELTEPDLDSAYTAGTSLIRAGTIEYVAVQVGSDIILLGDGQVAPYGAAIRAVVLQGKSLADVDFSSIGGTSASPSPSPPPPVSPPPVSPPPISPPPGGGSGQTIVGAPGGDTIQAPESNDTITSSSSASNYLRGNGGDDSIQGGTGNDFISGDRGNDTETGGAGADIFHGSQDAGIDRVLDFNLAEGDRVQLDPGTTYSVIQVGADTVIDMGSGNQMILVAVQLSSLKDGWII